MVRSKPSKLRWRVGGWVGGWMDGWMDGWVFTGNNATSWLHLASWNLPDSQLNWESKMEPSVAITWIMIWYKIWYMIHNMIYDTWYILWYIIQYLKLILIWYNMRHRIWYGIRYVIWYMILWLDTILYWVCKAVLINSSKVKGHTLCQFV